RKLATPARMARRESVRGLGRFGRPCLLFQSQRGAPDRHLRSRRQVCRLLGEGPFRFPHSIRNVREDGRHVVWLCDQPHEQFYKFTADGKLLQTIGEKGKRSDTGVPEDDLSSQAWRKVTHGGGPFNLPTDIAFAPSGEMFMTDGYGNARVHKFSADAKYQFSWE